MMNRNMVMSLVLSCGLLMVTVFGFAQSITVRDNASTTAPVDQVRTINASVLPSTASVKVSLDSATTTEDVTRTSKSYSFFSVKFQEVATDSALVDAVVPGMVTFQFNTDSGKLYIRLMEADGTTWGCVATLTDDLTSALN